jgi:hypothetical protein
MGNRLWVLIAVAVGVAALVVAGPLVAPRGDDAMTGAAVSDLHVAVGYWPWLDAAALKVLQTPSSGAWSLRGVVTALGEAVD